MKRMISVCAALLALLMIPVPALAQAAAPSPLNSVLGARALESRNFDAKVPVVQQWKAMTDRFKDQQANCQPAAGCALFKQLAAALNGLSIDQQLKVVRSDDDIVVYTSDQKSSGKADFWATPYETLSTKTGDAEDYAILGYYLLRSAGVSADKLRVLAVRLKGQPTGHAVLVADASNGPVILDILSKEITPAGFDTAAMTPVIGLNETGWWFYQRQ